MVETRLPFVFAAGSFADSRSMTRTRSARLRTGTAPAHRRGRTKNSEPSCKALGGTAESPLAGSSWDHCLIVAPANVGSNPCDPASSSAKHTSPYWYERKFGAEPYRGRRRAYQAAQTSQLQKLVPLWSPAQLCHTPPDSSSCALARSRSICSGVAPSVSSMSSINARATSPSPE